MIFECMVFSTSQSVTHFINAVMLALYILESIMLALYILESNRP